MRLQVHQDRFRGHTPIRAGFSLIELMIVIAIIAVIAAAAIPQLQAARLTANEASAAATLRAIAGAQAQIAGGARIDSNADGTGEFGYLAELAGVAPARIAAGGLPAAGMGGQDELLPSALSNALGRVQDSSAGHSGYLFQIWLPGEPVAGLVPGIAEDPTGGKVAAPFPDPVQSSVIWCAYAWPVGRNQTGSPAYFISNEGELLRYNNRGAVIYGGRNGGPAFDAAYTVAGSMASAVARPGVPGNDGNTWTVLD